MRVIECNECGEAISAADDEELAGRLSAHLEEEHDEDIGDADLEELVEEQAYDALDA